MVRWPLIVLVLVLVLVLLLLLLLLLFPFLVLFPSLLLFPFPFPRPRTWRRFRRCPTVVPSTPTPHSPLALSNPRPTGISLVKCSGAHDWPTD